MDQIAQFSVVSAMLGAVAGGMVVTMAYSKDLILVLSFSSYNFSSCNFARCTYSTQEQVVFVLDLSLEILHEGLYLYIVIL